MKNKISLIPYHDQAGPAITAFVAGWISHSSTSAAAAWTWIAHAAYCTSTHSCGDAYRNRHKTAHNKTTNSIHRCPHPAGPFVARAPSISLFTLSRHTQSSALALTRGAAAFLIVDHVASSATARICSKLYAACCITHITYYAIKAVSGAASPTAASASLGTNNIACLNCKSTVSISACSA